MLRTLLLLACVAPAARGLILTVGGAAEECVFERVEKDNKLEGSFEVVSGAQGALYLLVTGPSGEAHFSSEKARTSKFTVMAPSSGLYKVCLANKDREEKAVAVRGQGLAARAASRQQGQPAAQP